MKKIYLFLFLFYFSYVNSLHAQEVLNEFFEQNGDCYLLIGEGAAKNCWALNNLTTGVPQVLYKPNDAYGLTATLENDGSTTGKKMLYTFAAATGRQNVNLVGTTVQRHMVVGWSTKIWNFGQVPDKTVHRIHSRPWAGVTGLGNHDQSIYGSGTQNKFGNMCIPCDHNPNVKYDAALTNWGQVSGKPGWYYYLVGKYWYHAYDIPAYSNWTYNDGGAAGGPDAGRRQYLSQLGYTWNTKEAPIAATANGYYLNSQANADVKPANGPWCWLTCHADGSSSCVMTMSGWAHRVVIEYLYGNYIDMTLYSYRVGSGATSASSVQVVAKDVLASITGSQNRQGECTDGCIPAVNGVSLPGVEQPVLQCTYSPTSNRTYLYRRDADSSNYDLIGYQPGNDMLIGNPGDLTAKFLGISSKSSTSNYVYIMGKNLANQWLSDANAPASMLLNQVDDIAVSDQWWQTGGIVYVYDKTKKKVLCFKRKEGEPAGIPSEIYVQADGVLPDKIGADGFGSLYMLRTEFEPPDTTGFTKANISSKEFAYVKYGTTTNIYNAVYKQKVYKTVYRRLYTTGAIEKLSGRILLGENTFKREYRTNDNTQSGTITWEVPDSNPNAFVRYGTIIDGNTRSELAVINCPTPPRPENTKSVLDCIGPMVLSDTSATGFAQAVPTKYCKTCDKNTYQSTDESGEDMMYFFMVENAPSFDINELNIGNSNLLTDGDDYVGAFPTTLKKSTVKYYWKIIQTKDRDHNDVSGDDSVILDMEAKGQTGNYMLYFPSTLEGRFKVGVKMTYQYYDYTKLMPGDLYDKRETVLTDVIVAGDGAPANIDANGYAWNEIEIIQNPPPEVPAEAGVLMAGTRWNDASSYKPGPRNETKRQTGKAGDDLNGANVLMFGCGVANCTAHDYCKNNNEKEPAATKFIMDGYSLIKRASEDGLSASYNTSNVINWGLRLRETKFNYANEMNRIAMMMNSEPPETGDAKEIPNTKRWEGDPSATWQIELKKGSDTVCKTTKIVNRPYLTTDELRDMMPYISEPYAYHVTVTMDRTYSYQYFKAIPQFAPDGTVVTSMVNIPKIIKLKIYGDCEVIVTDNTPPGKFVYKPKNPSDSSDSEVVTPGYYCLNEYLKGSTGETLTNSENAGNPSKITFVVVDNNMFANTTDSYSGTKTGQYHYAASDQRFSRLQISFNNSNPYQRAMFVHGTVNGDMPPTTSMHPANVGNLTSPPAEWAAYVLKPTKLTSSEVSVLGIPYYKDLAYVKYEMPVSSLRNFYKRSDGTYDSIMDYSYATTAIGFSNLKYGIVWREACFRQTNPSSETTTDNILKYEMRTGQITIIDNDRPNPIIIGLQDKFLNDDGDRIEFYSPNIMPESSLTAYKQRWLPICTNPIRSNYIYNGVESIVGTKAGIYHNIYNHYADLIPTPTSVYTDIFLTKHPPTVEEARLEVDVPVVFTATATDNIVVDDYLEYEYLKLFKEDGTEVPDIKLINGATTAVPPMIQYVFREAGNFYVELKVKDHARNYPSQPDVYSPDANVKKAALTFGTNVELDKRMSRIIRADFQVYPTRLDLKILERQNIELR